MRNMLKKEEFQGLTLIVVGFILLFHTLGIIEVGLNYVIIIGSLLLIGYGMVKAGYDQKIMKLLKKKK